MKRAISIFVILLSVQAYGFGQEGKKVVDVSTNDSVEYELIIIDPGFETWLLSRPSENYHTQQYYENWNYRYVSEWNSRYLTNPARYPDIESYIDYAPGTDYGLELNYRLYWYFIYWEEKTGNTLVERGRKQPW